MHDEVIEIEAGQWARQWAEHPFRRYGITSETDIEAIQDIAERFEADIRAEVAKAKGCSPDNVLVVSAEEWVLHWCREAWQAALSSTVIKFKAAETRRNRLIRLLSMTGDSSRDLARRVGVSHSTVQRILRG